MVSFEMQFFYFFQVYSNWVGGIIYILPFSYPFRFLNDINLRAFFKIHNSSKNLFFIGFFSVKPTPVLKMNK